jgi:hypothetical protein
MTEIFENNQIPEEIKKFVIARLETFPASKGLSIGSQGTFSKTDLIEHVKEGDEVGKTMVKMVYEYLEMLKSGQLLHEVAAASK